MSQDREPEGEVWWIRSDRQEPWAGLRIAHFSGNHPHVFFILGEVPYRSGVRIWEDAVEREGWAKVERIPIPRPMKERYHYFRWHSHPLGWGVRDGARGDIVALGDKNICAAVAALLNGGRDMSVLDGWAEASDAYVKGGAPTWNPETD